MTVSDVAFCNNKRRLKHVDDFLYFQLVSGEISLSCAVELYIVRMRSLHFSMTIRNIGI